jgi:hypothetical protein
MHLTILERQRVLHIFGKGWKRGKKDTKNEGITYDVYENKG